MATVLHTWLNGELIKVQDGFRSKVSLSSIKSRDGRVPEKSGFPDFSSELNPFPDFLMFNF